MKQQSIPFEKSPAIFNLKNDFGEIKMIIISSCKSRENCGWNRTDHPRSGIFSELLLMHAALRYHTGQEYFPVDECKALFNPNLMYMLQLLGVYMCIQIKVSVRN